MNKGERKTLVVRRRQISCGCIVAALAGNPAHRTRTQAKIPHSPAGHKGIWCPLASWIYNRSAAPRRRHLAVRPTLRGPPRHSMASIELPRVARIRQRVTYERVPDVEAEVRRTIQESGVAARLRPGARIAITAGSRGIARIADVIRAAAGALRALGAEPFVVPAMGSHGGATAEGQREVLAGYGIAEDTISVPVQATMDVVEVGRTPAGVPVYMDRHAWEADGVLVCGRVKAHTAFKAPIESGLCKMIAVGLGKQRGAETMHGAGLAETIPEAAAVSLASGKIVLGLAIVENGAD